MNSEARVARVMVTVVCINCMNVGYGFIYRLMMEPVDLRAVLQRMQLQDPSAVNAAIAEEYEDRYRRMGVIAIRPSPPPRPSARDRALAKLRAAAMPTRGWPRPIPAPYPCPECGLYRKHYRDQVLEAVELIISHPPPMVLPDVPPKLSRQNAEKLARQLKENPSFPRTRYALCPNCSLDHSARVCPFRRGTRCGSCNQQGVRTEECPYCNPKLYGLK